MSRRLRWLLLAVLVGCGGKPEVEGAAESETGSVAQEVACSESTLASTTCAGPWEYQLQCYKSVPDAMCKISGYNTAACCRLPANGVESRTTVYRTLALTYTKSRVLVCDSAYKKSPTFKAEKGTSQGGGNGPDEPIPPPGCTYEYVYNYSPDCDATAAAEVSALKDPETDPAKRAYYVLDDITNDTLSTATCYYHISNYPTYLKAINSSCTSTSPDYGQCTNTNSPIYYSCRHSNHGTDTDCSPVKNYSNPNLTSAGLDAEAKVVWDARQSLVADDKKMPLTSSSYVWVSENGVSRNARCTTTENLAMSSNSDVQTKFNTLNTWYTNVDSLPSGSPQNGVDRAALKSKLIRRLKLLFELRASQLTPAQQTLAMNLYGSAPSELEACGSTWTPPPAPSCTTSRTTLDGYLTMCQRMLDGSVTNITSDLLDRCANQASAISPLSLDVCNGTGYRGEYQRLNQALLNKNLASLVNDLGTDARTLELRDKLGYIDAWYNQSRLYLYPAGTPDPALLADTSKLLKTFWNQAYLQRDLSGTPAAFGTDAEAEAFRKKVLVDGLVADRQVLTAAFTQKTNNALPMQSAALLYVVGDALHGLEERLEEVSRMHDMGCRFKSCGSSPTTTSQLWELLANVDDSASLSTATNAATLVSPSWTQTKDAAGTVTAQGPFALMATNHAAFQSAVKDALGLPSSTAYSRSLLSGASVDSLSHPAQGVAALLKDAKVRAASYAVNGLFTTTNRRQVQVGLDRAKQDAILGELNTTVTDLNNQITTYHQNRLNLVNGLLTQLKNQADQGNINNRIDVLTQQMGDLSMDLGGLRISHAVDEARFGDFMEGFEALVPAIETAGENFKKDEVSLNVNALDDTRHDTVGNSDLSLEWVQENGAAFAVTAAAGDSLNVQVSGQWAPTCALSKVQMPGGKTLSYAGVMTGPEGYLLSETSSGYTAQAVQTVTSEGKYANSSVGVKACAGGGMFGLSVEGCASYEQGDTWSQTQSTTDSSGRENKATFSLARGIRSAYAPFADQPVGALLLVQMPPDPAPGTEYKFKSDVYSVQVLQAPYTSVFVDKPSKFYLVVNDYKGCSGISNSALSLRVTHVVPMTQAAREVAQAMLNTLTAVAPDLQSYVAQGRLLPTQATHVRNVAYQKLFEQCSQRADTSTRCSSITQYPESLRNLFDTWLSKEVVDMERQVEVVQIERQIRALVLEVRNLSRDLGQAQTQARMMALTPAWSLRNLDGSQLRMKLDALDQILSDWLAPVVDLLNPETRTQFTVDERAKLDALTAIDPLTADIETLSGAAKDAASAVEQRLRLVRTSAPTPTFQEVIISIPKPGRTVLTTWNKTDTETSIAVWNDIQAGRNPSLNLKPEFVYKVGQRYLSCNMSAPIINSMALSLAWSSAGTYSPFTVPVTVSPEMAFPTVDALQNYDFVNGRYLGPQAEALVGVSANALTAFQSYWAQPGKLIGTGLSPFTTLYLDLSSFRAQYPNNTDGTLNLASPLARADELLVGLRLEPRQEAPGVTLPGVPSCQ